MKTPEQMAEEYANDLAEDFDRLFPEDAAQPFIETFLAGYKVAQEHAHAALEEAEAKMQELRDQLAGVSKVMPDSCDHILDATKMVDVNGWISVNDRLPEIETTRDDYERSKAVLWIDHEKNMVVASYVTIRERTRVMTGFSEPPISNFTHWQELPEPPKEEK
jgi:hypothetical protein